MINYLYPALIIIAVLLATWLYYSTMDRKYTVDEVEETRMHYQILIDSAHKTDTWNEFIEVLVEVKWDGIHDAFRVEMLKYLSNTEPGTDVYKAEAALEHACNAVSLIQKPK